MSFPLARRLCRDYVQLLESRRLLSLTLVGPETVVPVDAVVDGGSTALAVAGDGSFLVAGQDLGGRAGVGDYLEGGAGDDTLSGGGNDGLGDALFGLAGNDVFFTAGGFFPDTVRGGPGEDSADADNVDDVLAVETIT